MAGGYLIYVGVADVSFVEALRTMLQTGTPPVRTQKAATELPSQLQFSSLKKGSGLTVGGEAGSAVVGGTTLGKKIAETALQFKGVKYVWGGTSPLTGWDCSGMVYYVLNKCGIKVARLQSTLYLAWPGASTVPRAECAAGDLCVWVGHIGIAISNTEMVHAPMPGQVTKVAPIDGAKGAMPVSIRRVRG